MRRVNSGSQLGSHEGSSHYEWLVVLRDLGIVSTASGQLADTPTWGHAGESFQTRTVKTEQVRIPGSSSLQLTLGSTPYLPAHQYALGDHSPGSVFSPAGCLSRSVSNVV